MARRKALDVTISDGTVLNLSQKDYWNRKGEFQAKVKPQMFVRVGDYHLAIGRDLAAYYEETPSIPPGWLDTWESVENQKGFMRMRLDICNKIEDAILAFPNHPHYAAIMQAIEAERAGWDRFEEVAQ